MCAARILLICVFSLCVGVTCQAVTFEKVSSTFSLDYSAFLDCSGADPGTRNWNVNFTEDDFSKNYVSWGHTPILKKGSAFLVGLNNNETASTDMLYGGPGSGGQSESSSVSYSDPYYNRVNTYVMQRPVLTFYQPGYGYSYGVDVDVTTNATTYYKITPLRNESIGDEIILTVAGWTEHEENSHGSTQITGHNSINLPGYINLVDGIYHQVNGTTQFTAHIGDTIGMHTSVNSTVNSSGTIGSWVQSSYMPCGLLAMSRIDVSAPLMEGLAAGYGLQASEVTVTDSGDNKYRFTDIYIDEYGTEKSLWFSIPELLESYTVDITDNWVAGIELPYYRGYDDLLISYLGSDGNWVNVSYNNDAAITFAELTQKFVISGFDWSYTYPGTEETPDSFSLGLYFAGAGTQVDIYKTSAVPEPSSIVALGFGLCAVLPAIRRRRL